jgi:hypothetical protein
LTRKGRLEEIFSKAIHADDPSLYFVSYRDFENIIEFRLDEFVKLSENFSIIPASRITRIRRVKETLYIKSGF